VDAPQVLQTKKSSVSTVGQKRKAGQGGADQSGVVLKKVILCARNCCQNLYGHVNVLSLSKEEILNHFGGTHVQLLRTRMSMDSVKMFVVNNPQQEYILVLLASAHWTALRTLLVHQIHVLPHKVNNAYLSQLWWLRRESTVWRSLLAHTDREVAKTNV
jgi:hypothetical protein